MRLISAASRAAFFTTSTNSLLARLESPPHPPSPFQLDKGFNQPSPLPFFANNANNGSNFHIPAQLQVLIDGIGEMLCHQLTYLALKQLQ